MEQNQVNPERIRSVGRSLVTILTVSAIYIPLALLLSQVKVNNASTLKTVMNLHYGLAGFCGLFIVVSLISICLNLIRCTEK
jgi:hypothetical protein